MKTVKKKSWFYYFFLRLGACIGFQVRGHDLKNVFAHKNQLFSPLIADSGYLRWGSNMPLRTAVIVDGATAVHIQKSGKSPNLLSTCIQWFCCFCDTSWRAWLLCVVWDLLWLQTEIIIEKEESKEEITLHYWYMYLPDIQIKSGLFYFLSENDKLIKEVSNFTALWQH